MVRTQRYIFLLLMLLQSAICDPRTPQYLNLQNFPPPDQVNQLYYSDLQDPTASVALNGIDDVVLQVEQLIKSHPNLPRLTRGEILDLLENITRGDYQKHQQSQVSTRGRNPKAYMVVKAYSPEEDGVVKMEELYTKTPVTRIVATQEKGEEPFEYKVTPTKKPHRVRTRPSTTTTTSVPVIPTLSTSSTVYPEVPQSIQLTEKPVVHHRRRRPIPANDLEKTRKVSTTEPPITTYSSRRRRPIIRYPISTTEKHPNHRYPEEERSRIRSSTSLPSGEKVAEQSQQYDPYQVNDDLMMVENSRKEVPLPLTRNTDGPYYQHPVTKLPEVGTVDILQKGVPVERTSNPSKTQTSRQPPSEPQFEPNLQGDLSVLAALNAIPARTTAAPTTVPDISPVADNLSAEMRDLLATFGLIQGPQPVEDESKNQEGLFTPEKAEVNPDSYVGFKPLPVNDEDSKSEMEQFLARFGLGRNSKNEQPERKSSNEEDMTFDVVPQQYQGVLEDIGLSNRGAKKIRTEPVTKTVEKKQAFPLPRSNQEEIEKLNKLLNIIQRIETLNKTLSEEDVDSEHIKQVLSSLNVANVNPENEEDRENAATEETLTPLDEQNAPNPLNYDKGLSKNEIKREENAKNDSDGKKDSNEEKVAVVTPSVTLNAEESVSATTASANTEAHQTANIKDLEDSFGGKTDPPTEPPHTEPATKRTGFYYLVDWNTFLEVDDQKGKRVNLRFQPTIGDPKRFYSVSVP